MIAHRVGELALSLRAAEGRAAAIVPRAERFARNVLDRCTERIEAHSPGRIVLIRRLPLAWRLGESSLDDATAVSRCADDAAESIERALRAAGPPHPDDEVVAFDDEPHWRASHLRDSVRGGASGAWFYAALEAEGDPTDVALAPGRRALTEAIVARLASGGSLVEVLASLGAGRCAALARAVGVPTGEEIDDAPALAEPSGPVAGAAGALASGLVEFARTLPAGLPTAGVRLALWAEARRRLGDHAPNEAANEAVRIALRRLRGIPPRIGERPGPLEEPVNPRGAVLARDDGSADAGIATRFGGLFYLLTCALELDLGEAIWKACLPEGLVFAHGAALILGDGSEGDPAPRLFGGVEEVRPLPPIEPEQQDEIGAALLAGLVEALPRRGLAALPEVGLDLVAHASGRHLVATAAGSPFALFARPTPGPGSVREALRAFLASWPASAPPISAPPGLADLDLSGRVRPRSGPSRRTSIVIPEADSAAASALLAQISGSLATLFLARVEGDLGAASLEVLRAHLTLPARVARAPGMLTIQFGPGAIDLAVRRAGLDRDPGWVPWLARTVQFDYDGLDRELEPGP